MNWVTTVLLLAGASGCSLIYNPSNLPPAPGDGPQVIDLPPDEPVIDADPAMLMLDPIAQGPLLEGQGIGGSQPAVLFVSGENLIEGTTLTVAPTVANPDVSITVSDVTVAVTHHSIGALVTANLSPLPEGAPIELTVTVTPPAPFEAAAKTVTWAFKPLDSFTATGTDVAAPADGKLFSDATIDGSLSFAGGASSQRGIIRAVSSIAVLGNATISANAAATGKVPGAGGCEGGGPGTDGTCFGKGGGSTSGGGGGGGFNGAGTAGGSGGSAGQPSGSVELANFGLADVSLENRGGGGGGGAGGIGNGGEGGGGGGTIELTAGGDLNLAGATLRANGAAGGPGGGVAGSSGGGGGAGGVILLRAGGTFTAPAKIEVLAGAKGAAGLAGKVGGDGAPGRIREDSTTDITVANGAYVGPMVVRPASLIVRAAQVPFDLHAKASDNFTVNTKHPDGSVDIKTVTAFAAGEQVIPLLQPGINRVCAVVTNGSLSNAEGSNCIEVGYIP